MTLVALALAWLSIGIVAGRFHQISHENAEPIGFLRPAASTTIGAGLGGLVGNLVAGQPVPSADPSGLIGTVVGVVVAFRLHAEVDRRLRRRS